MAVRLWLGDPHLAVLRKLVIEARNIYLNLTVVQEKPEELLMKHKFSVEWLIEEIIYTVRKYDKWSRGRTKLPRLLEIRYELQTYFNKTLVFPYEEVVRLFDIYHADFNNQLTNLDNLFGP